MVRVLLKLGANVQALNHALELPLDVCGSLLRETKAAAASSSAKAAAARAAAAKAAAAMEKAAKAAGAAMADDREDEDEEEDEDGDRVRSALLRFDPSRRLLVSKTKKTIHYCHSPPPPLQLLHHRCHLFHFSSCITTHITIFNVTHNLTFYPF
jgi:hypothetical protein